MLSTLRPELSRTLRSAALLLALIQAPGCGYSLVGRASNLPADVGKVYIRPLENKTQRSQVEQFLTSAIAKELVTRRRFQVVSTATGADAELSGAVTGFVVTPVTFDREGRATEYEISILTRMSFRRIAEPATELWSNDRYQFRENYKLDVSAEGFFDLEDTAIEKLSERFAETLVTTLLEGF